MTTRRSWLRSLGLPLLAWGLPRPVPAQPRVLRFTFSRAQEDPRTQWLIAVYRELLAGLGLGFEFIDAPAGRGTLMVLGGQADGELGRTYGYQDLHPSLLRLHEPNNRVEFAIYGNQPAQVFAGWEAPRRDGWRCEYRRGIPELELLLQQQLPTDRISAIGTIAQGLRRLQLGRTDAYLDVKEAIDDFFRFRRASAELLAGPLARELAVVQSTTGHAYLQALHAPLVEPMSQQLRRMKQEGRVQALLDEALRAADLAAAR